MTAAQPPASDLQIVKVLEYNGRFAAVPCTWGRGRYRWVEHVDEGGQGYVELARDEWSNALVVVKGAWWGDRDNSIEPEYAPATYERRMKEVEQAVAVQAALGEITHGVPILIDIVRGPSPTRHERGALLTGVDQAEVDRFNSEAFIVMQFVGDHAQHTVTTLSAFVAEAGELSEAEVISLADQISATLEAMHTVRPQQGFETEEREDGLWVHGDIKPDNILVWGSPPRYCVIDLSTARLVRRGEKVRPREATPGYAPPDPDEVLSPRYDLYSLAATLLFALTGEPPQHWLGGETVARSGPSTNLNAPAGGAGRAAPEPDSHDGQLARLRGELAARQVHPMVIRLITDCLPEDPKRRLRSASVLRAEIAAVRTALAARELLTTRAGRS